MADSLQLLMHAFRWPHIQQADSSELHKIEYKEPVCAIHLIETFHGYVIPLRIYYVISYQVLL